MGNADKIFATINEFVELGVDTFHLQFPIDILEQQFTQFGEKVIARVRGKHSVFPAEAGIQGWGGGANPDTNPLSPKTPSPLPFPHAQPH